MSGVELEMLVDSLATNNTEYKETKENLNAKKIKNKFEAALVKRKLYHAYTSSKPLEVEGCFMCEVLVGKQRTQQRTATVTIITGGV